MADVYKSATERLTEMPEIFRGSDLTVKFQWTAATASTYLAHWRHAGLVKSLGGRSDVHMNLVVNRNVNLELALRRAYPKAVRIGIDVLREAGWTTQISRLVDVAIPKDAGLYDVGGFMLHQRLERWFKIVAPGTQSNAQGLDSLRPAWAFADMIARAVDKRAVTANLTDPDDLDLDRMFESNEMATALSAFGLESSPESYQALYADWLNERQQRHSLPVLVKYPG